MGNDFWVLYPSASKDRGEECRDKWHGRGYSVGIYCDANKPAPDADYVYQSQYPGYWAACNVLVRMVMENRGAKVVTLIGDDMDPDPTYTASDIGTAYLERFPDGFGVLQACGDPQGKDKTGTPSSARICGSPTFGTGWAYRAYLGRGPCPEEYHHFWGDEELKNVAELLGVLWMEPKYSFFHRHWSFGHEERQEWQKRNEKHSRADHRTFLKRKALGWPGHDPLPAGLGGINRT